ncbi:MAG: hypothetical protein ACRDNG_03600 [Gaiellaceae bacterium]
MRPRRWLGADTVRALQEAWLALRILGVALFLANIIVTAVWKMLAD